MFGKIFITQLRNCVTPLVECNHRLNLQQALDFYRDLHFDRRFNTPIRLQFDRIKVESKLF